MPTNVEVFQQQSQHMLSIARSLDDRGYAVMVRGMNRAGEDNRYPYRFVTGAIEQLADTIGKGLLINVYVDAKRQDDVRAGRVKLVDAIHSFSVRVPNRVRFRHVMAAIEMAATLCYREWVGGHAEEATRLVKGKPVKFMRMVNQTPMDRVVGTGPLNAKRSADYLEVTGNRRAQLEILVRLFDAPHIRDILRGGK